jgi:hypothetical protein
VGRQRAAITKLAGVARVAAAARRLSGTQGRREAFAAIDEVLVHLLGAEALAILEPMGDELRFAWSRGIEAQMLHRVRVGYGIVGSVALDQEPYFASGAATHSWRGPIAVLPLDVRGALLAVLAIVSLRSKEPSLSAPDRELLGVVRRLGAHALYFASLDSERPTIPPARGGR